MQKILRIVLARAAFLPSKLSAPAFRSFNLRTMTGAAKNAWEASYRIPSTMRPTHYDLYLHPKMEDGDFSGRVTVHLSTDAEHSHFAVHVAKPLEVTSTSVVEDGGDGKAVDVAKAFVYQPHEFWVVQLANKAPKGNYRVTMEFRGRLDQSILGFYRSVYTNASGKKRYIATSKFQPTYARRCFPCIDEPSFKSTYRYNF